MRPSDRKLLEPFLTGAERRLRVGENTGTEVGLVGGGVLWVADGAPEWAVRRIVEKSFHEAVRCGFGDEPTIVVECLGLDFEG